MIIVVFLLGTLSGAILMGVVSLTGVYRLDGAHTGQMDIEYLTGQRDTRCTCNACLTWRKVYKRAQR